MDSAVTVFFYAELRFFSVGFLIELFASCLRVKNQPCCTPTRCCCFLFSLFFHIFLFLFFFLFGQTRCHFLAVHSRTFYCLWGGRQWARCLVFLGCKRATRRAASESGIGKKNRFFYDTNVFFYSTSMFFSLFFRSKNGEEEFFFLPTVPSVPT